MIVALSLYPYAARIAFRGRSSEAAETDRRGAEVYGSEWRGPAARRPSPGSWRSHSRR